MRRTEGPFGDHYGYYSLEHPFPVFEVEKIYHRKDAIFPATVVGRPRQEDHYIGEYLQKLFSPIFPLVMNGVVSVWAYDDAGVHTLASAVVCEARLQRFHVNLSAPLVLDCRMKPWYPPLVEPLQETVARVDAL